MTEIQNALELAIEPNLWRVEMRDGSRIEILAHAYSVEGDDCVFSLLFKGTPHFEVTSLRIPLTFLPEGFS